MGVVLMKKQFNNNSRASTSSNVEAKEFLGKMGIDYTENTKTGEITVDGNLNILNQNLKKLPDLTMVIVKGNFWCYGNQLTTLDGSPQNVSGSFSCSGNQLTSLVGSPQSIGGGFYCYGNDLTTLEGAPQIIGDDFSCHNNKLTSLIGAPKIVEGYFNCDENLLTNLAGAPESVGLTFSCINNPNKELRYEEPYDQYWIAPTEIKPIKPIKQVPDKKTRTQKIADFRRFAKARIKKTINSHK